MGEGVGGQAQETVLGLRRVEGRPQKHLALILARELASQLATAAFVADATGGLVFFNEPAEEILGRTFAEAGPMPAEGWASQFSLADLDGSPLPMERRPAHGQLWMTGLDGQRRLVSITAAPLFSSPTEFVGMIALFWQEPEQDDA